jgi:hypothetical protein
MTVSGDSGLPRVLGDVVDTALGTARRDDPITGRTGGPAGNARLTAWLGLALLAFFLAECVTLISLHQLIDVHLFIGALLVPLALVKTATTGWRIARYYTGKDLYVEAGPPPTLLRLLGPLVILGALAVLGTGLSLVALGQAATFQPFMSVAGFQISPLTLHQIAFAVWLATTGLHALVRTVAALRLAAGREPSQPVPGRVMRTVLMAAVMIAGVGTGAIILHLSHDWSHHSDLGFRHRSH